MTITVNPVVDLTAAPDTNITNEDTPVNGSVAGNDSTTSNGTLTFDKATDPANGTVTMNPDGSYIYTPKPNFNGTDSFTYTVTDPASGESKTETVTITVNPVNDAPVITEGAQSDSVIESGHEDDGSTIVPGTPSASGTFTATDVDAGDNAKLTWSVQGIPDSKYGNFTITAGGQWTYALNNNLAATQALKEGETKQLTFTVQVSDGNGGTATQTVTITIHGTNDAPVAVADTASVQESGVKNGGIDGEAGKAVASGNVLSNDTDVDAGETATLKVTGVSLGSTTGVLGQSLQGAYGSLVLKADGTYEYTLDNSMPATQALAQGAFGTETFTYTIVDANGAVSTSTLTITVQGTNDQPTITSSSAEATGEVTEQGTSNPKEESTVSGQLTARDEDAGAKLTWSVESTQGKYGTISMGTDGKWVYTLNNSLPATQALNNGDTGTETFKALVRDEHGAYREQEITITVHGSNDDLQGQDFVDTLLEDPAGGSHTGTLQDHVSDVDNTIVLVSFQVAGDGTVYQPGETAVINGVGSVTINLDGSYTFTPEKNYSGEVPDITFTVKETGTSGKTATNKLTFKITPVSDAPDLDSNKTLNTNEDTSVTLGLKLPEIKDGTDGNGVDVGDSPERLGTIELAIGGAGAAGVTLSTGSTVLTPVNGKLIIVITDEPHITDVPAADAAQGIYHLKRAEYEALIANPKAEIGDNFTVTVTATSYEVDESGAKLANVNGASSSQTITVDVQAVTDGATLSLSQSALSMEEDSSIDLSSYLTATLTSSDANPGNDTDSETYWYTVSGLPKGSVVTIDGKAYTVGDSGSVTSDVSNTLNVPNIQIKPAGDYSGSLGSIQITLYSQDTDSDSTGAIGTVTSSVNLTLNVSPKGGDVAVSDVSTEEDTAVAFLQHVRVTDTGTDYGEEVIDSVSFTVPSTGGVWVVIAPTTHTPSNLTDGYTISGNGTSGTYTITFNNDTGAGTVLTEAQRESVLGGFTIKPPAHSSADATIPVTVTSTDTNTATGSSDTASETLNVKVTVTPVAEEVGKDSNGNSTSDLTMTSGHAYSVHGAEDVWFALNSDGFDLKAGWSNEDSGSEATFAQFTPYNSDKSQTLIGSSFKYTDASGEHTVIFTGEPVRIPLSALGTVQFKGANNFKGEVNIKVEAVTIDYDEDTPHQATAPKVSGGAWLSTLEWDPVADQVTLKVEARVSAKEDGKFSLNITTLSDDPSETFTVTIKGIPAGSVIVYGGTLYDTNAITLPPELERQADGSYALKLTDYNSKTPPFFTPPKDMSGQIKLTVEAISVDGTSESSIKSLPINITVVGDPDIPVFEVDNTKVYVENNLDSASPANRVALKDLITDLQSGEMSGDGSETLTLRISGLGDGFTLIGGGYVVAGTGASGAESRVWVVTLQDLQSGKAQIQLPPNFSGTVEFFAEPVVTEKDTPSKVFPGEEVSFTVTPSPEASLNISSTVSEDTIGKINLSASLNGDSDEFISAVRIEADPRITLYSDAEGTQPLTPVNGWYEFPSAAAVGSVYVKGPANASGNIPLNVQYKVTDPSTDGTLSSVETGWINTQHTLQFVAKTDEVDLSIAAINGDASSSSLVVNQAGKVTVDLDIGKKADPAAGGTSDYDGSEKLTYIVIEGVPSGVVVEGAQFTGNGTWLLTVNEAFTGDIAKSIVFDVGGNAVQGDHSISITVYTQDGSASVVTEQVSWNLSIDLGDDGQGKLPEVSLTPIDPPVPQTEDISFKLSEVVKGTLDVTDADQASFDMTVTIRTAPGDATQFSGPGLTRTEVMENGKPVVLWTLTVPSVTNATAQQALEDALANIEVKPASDANSNNLSGGHLPLDVTVTLYSNGLHSEDGLKVEVDIDPVTDKAQVSTDSAAVSEGVPADVTINVSSPKDGSAWHVVDGKIYLQVDSGSVPGTLQDGNGPLTPTYLTDVPNGMQAGNYYVIEGYDPSNPPKLTYVPTNPHDRGSVEIKTWVETQENGSSVVELGTGSTQVTFNPVNTEPTAVVDASKGVEHDGETLSMVELKISGSVLVDPAETMQAAFITGLPPDFAVYYDDGTGYKLASNAGKGTWSIPVSSTGLPSKIGVLPPAHWSGTLEDLTLHLVSGEAGQEPTTWPLDFDLTVAPKADGLEIAATLSFGKAGELIGLNLNAAMKDPVASGTSDGHTELATIKLSGLPDGDKVSFYINGVALDDSKVTYVNGVHTITGLTQAELDGLQIQHLSTNGNKTVTVTGWTQEYDSDGNAVGDPSSAVSDNLTLNVSDQFATASDNVLLWTGGPIDGMGGSDTIVLRHGESLSGGALAEKLKNVEALDLSAGGENKITDLTAENVLNMTDARHVLTIKGTADDQLQLKNMGEGWSDWAWDQSTQNYTSTKGSDKVTVHIDGVDVVDGSLARMSSFSMMSWGDLLSTDSGSINLDNVLPASSQTTTTLAAVVADSSAADSSALYAPLPQSALDDELNQLSVAHY